MTIRLTLHPTLHAFRWPCAFRQGIHRKVAVQTPVSWPATLRFASLVAGLLAPLLRFASRVARRPRPAPGNLFRGRGSR